MTRTPVIPKARPDHPSLDFDVLRSEGVRHLENLATELWTDFNAHDPGITLLELLCYAITDLGYRSRMLPIGDLVAGSKEKAFFEALEILPSAPVTARDYRKLLIDVKGVKNAWVEKYGPTDQAKDLQVFASGSGIVFFEKLANNVENEWVLKDDAVEKMTGFLEDFFPDAGAGALQNKLEQVQGWVTNGLDFKNISIENQDLARAFTRRFGCIRFPLSKDYLDESTQIVYNGLVKITLDLDDHIDPENESQTRPVIQRAMRRLQANRTLCQDFVEPPVLVGKLPVAICLHLEVEPGKDAVEVAAEAIWRIEQHLRPILRFYTFREMRARGRSVEEIYNGPLLDNGFLDNLEVDAAQLLTEFHHSDLTNAATVKPGVDTVHELKVKVFNDAKFDIKTTYTIFKPETGNDSDPTPYNRTRPLKPVINLCESCILVTQNGFRRELSEAALQEPLRLKRLLAGCYDEPGGLETPTGIARPDLTEYRSLQYDLPGIYGVGDYDVSDETPADQKGRRKQLQAYLAFFDQILAAYLLQLGHIRQLLSVEQDPRLPTYLTADLRNIPGLMEVIDPDKSFSAESPATRADRRNRLLNHLLARFGETFSDFVVGILRADTGVEDNPFSPGFQRISGSQSQLPARIARAWRRTKQSVQLPRSGSLEHRQCRRH
ncbi:MAG: hypothetical protein IPM36_03665 [Lewinellaceae bacterium]|nr:hypothetical protein [Lewinellaceae bacterium]